MKLKFEIHNPHNIPVAKSVMIDGQPVTASLDGFEVTLKSQDGMSGSLTLRFFGMQANEARELFTKGSGFVTVSVTSASAPAAAAA